ncbi:MAG: hypothetical protein HFE93_12875 [Acutalibacter muris]|nr:hypothetical protein [Acutalibacter muris]
MHRDYSIDILDKSMEIRESARLDIPKGCLGALLSMDYFALCELYSRPQIAFTISCSNKRYDELCSLIQLLLLAYAGNWGVLPSAPAAFEPLSDALLRR